MANPIRVAVIGLSDGETKAMRSLARVTVSRERAYTLVEGGSLATADLYLVDADRADAVQGWRVVYSKTRATSVFVSASGEIAEPGTTPLKRPIIASRLLGFLDRLDIRIQTEAASADEDLDFTSGRPAPAPATPAARRRATTQPVQRIPATPDRAAEADRTRALIVDDSPTVRKQLELALRPYDVVVDTAESGEIALLKLSERRYNIVFLDVVLPGWDGYQICKAIKKDKAQKHTPVVMLTSKSSPFDKIRGSLAGCDTYLTKPVDKAVFEGVVRKYLVGLAAEAPLMNARLAVQ